MFSQDYRRCLCADGWGGPDCSVELFQHQLIFTELFNSALLSDSLDHLRKMLPRFGHSLLADHRSLGTSLWMFGGYSLSHGPLNDIRLFDTKNNTWMQVCLIYNSLYCKASFISGLKKYGMRKNSGSQEGNDLMCKYFSRLVKLANIAESFYVSICILGRRTRI